MKRRAPRIPEALTSPSVNRGTAFTLDERRELGQTGRLPSAVLSLEVQARRLWEQLLGLPTDLARNLLLEQVHNRNEVLYFKVLSEHLIELLPVVYDPTVGEAIEKYSNEYLGQRGVYLSIDRPDEIAESFATLGLGPDDVDLIVCSDAEQILGIGDWGVGGIQIAIGKLAIYTAGAGIDPWRTIPGRSMSAPTTRGCSTTRSIWVTATHGTAAPTTTRSSRPTSRPRAGQPRARRRRASSAYRTAPSAIPLPHPACSPAPQHHHNPTIHQTARAAT